MALTKVSQALGSTPSIDDNGTATAITIDSSQNVGIGVASPAAPLQVVSTIGDWTADIKNYSTDAYGLRIDLSGSTGAGFAQATYTATGTGFFVKNDGSVGIGTTSLDSYGKFAIRGGITVSAGSTSLTGTSFSTSDAANSTFWINHASAVTNLVSDAPMAFFGPSGSGVAERMRIDGSGNLLVGTTATPSFAGLAVGSTASGKNISVFSSSNGSNGVISVYQSNGTSEGQLYAGTGNVNLFGTSVVKIVAATAGVQLTSGATSWTSISDERAKDIIEPISNAVQKVSNLRSVIGKYKTDSEGTRRSFLIAQDVQAVFPEAVDTTDEDNLGVRYTETIPLLVAAIKEQQAIIDDLKARIETLEGA